ncbi:hypothetical protein LEP1GSC062_3825 [Leptospira alexanderi serovar Manhao 3 str. L 60]|uniref:Uncharacterized protein n=1 Tax=Leptospira alexanderi serovar Manhao 3 str. L 60 TaxID=1049759 RepID=V6IFR3_9LEPT|nr:hypothetical protein LEP1GSC062_3825 [Leptospira alexanderi serovar Manhao 3 str. L 60]
MIISWEKMRHPHPKEEWKKLLEKVDVIQENEEVPTYFPKNIYVLRRKQKKGPLEIHSLSDTTQNKLKRVRVQTRNSFFRFLGNSIT